MESLKFTDKSRFVRSTQSLLLAAVLGLLWILSRHDFVTFHAIIELTTVFVSGMIALAGYKASTHKDARPLALLSTLYLCVAFVDLAHTLSYKGSLFAEGLGNNPPTQFWILARLVESMGLALVFLCPFQCRYVEQYIKVLVLATVTGVCAIYPLEIFPDAFLDGQGLTPFKIYSEYVVISFVLLAAIGVWMRRRSYQSLQVHYLMISFALTMGAEFCFTQYASVYGDANAAGHLFRLASNYFLYRGILVDQNVTSNSLYKANPLHITIVVLTCVIWGTVALSVRYIEKEAKQRDDLYLYQQRLQGLAISLQAALDSKFRLTDSLEAFVQSRPDFTPEEFTIFAERMLEKTPYITSLQLAPQGIVTYVTNVERNQKAVGHNLLQDPKRKNGVMKAITSRSTIVDGPLTLRQGGQALIARAPVYLPSHDLTQRDVFWGFATVIIDLEALLQSTPITAFDREFSLAIRAVNPVGDVNAVIFGRDETDANPILSTEIALSNSRWVLSMSGRRAAYVMHTGFILSSWYWIYLLLSTGVIAIGLYRILTHRVQVTKAVSDATEHWQQEVERRQEVVELERRLATQDELTGIANRRHFYDLAHDHLAQARAQGQPFTLYYMDLDGFKDVNDSYGHSMGDEVLKVVAHRLQNSVRAQDIVARFGGDEFVAILRNTDDDCFYKSQQIIEAISAPIVIDGSPALIGISIGAAVYPTHGDSIEALLVKADSALYQAKRRGKNCLVVA
ncbi:sensor domain-containing diguanylate cyclase [Vibrio furnissii]|uniref:sensor domain-containing diguanylate cyclase n=1 Tax=Vibrio furnissii TaxID=29494 RepID=UPI001302707E|nr:sensor domain-containing diguanylate cyclase [Vibrio furnissii]